MGGYKECRVKFYPKPSYFLSPTGSSDTLPPSDEKKDVLVYIATPDNRHWIGFEPLPKIARQILDCHGPSGSNVEYLLRLADFMRHEVPEALDEHLFSLERLIHIFAEEMSICLRSLMGDSKYGDEMELSKPEPRATVSFQYAARVPEKKLRCVNM